MPRIFLFSILMFVISTCSVKGYSFEPTYPVKVSLGKGDLSEFFLEFGEHSSAVFDFLRVKPKEVLTYQGVKLLPSVTAEKIIIEHMISVQRQSRQPQYIQFYSKFPEFVDGRHSSEHGIARIAFGIDRAPKSQIIPYPKRNAREGGSNLALFTLKAAGKPLTNSHVTRPASINHIATALGTAIGDLHINDILHGSLTRPGREGTELLLNHMYYHAEYGTNNTYHIEFIDFGHSQIGAGNAAMAAEIQSIAAGVHRWKEIQTNLRDRALGQMFQAYDERRKPRTPQGAIKKLYRP